MEVQHHSTSSSCPKRSQIGDEFNSSRENWQGSYNDLFYFLFASALEGVKIRVVLAIYFGHCR